MAWENTSFENEMQNYLREKFNTGSEGDKLFMDYVQVRNSMEDDNFLSEIKGQEKDLSDHSKTHIKDVLDRCFKVIGESFNDFNVHEVYCLALMILFHDVGNIYGREDHHHPEKIAKVYKKYRANAENYRQEIRILTNGASAHSGKSRKDNSSDTLKDVQKDNYKGSIINLRELAAILRFSDELAEGKQRTCSFMIENNLFKDKNAIYHKYAQIVDIAIDRQGGRIAVSFDIEVPKKFNKTAQKEFLELLNFSYFRAEKLDLERRYTKCYSNVIKDFTRIEIKYNFTSENIPLSNIDLRPIVLQDQIPLPDLSFKEYTNERKKRFLTILTDEDDNYEPTKLIELIKKEING